MVSSSHIPDGFVLRWKADNGQGQSSPLSSAGNAFADKGGHRKLRSACELCRSARVRCDGGSPCQRCRIKSWHCQYKISLRNGRLRTRSTHDTSSAALSVTESTPESSTTDFPNAILSPENAIVQPSVQDSFSYTAQHSTLEVEPAGDVDFSSILTGSLDYLELPDLATMFPNDTIAGSPPRTLPPAALTHDLLGRQPSIASQVEPVFNSPDQPLVELEKSDQSPRTQCSCLKSQLRCIAEACGQVDYDGLTLDLVLTDVRQITQITSDHVRCPCQKTSTGLVIFSIALQRALLSLCYVSRHPERYIQGLKVAIGNFQLSDEEDRDHKRLLVESATERLRTVANRLEATALECLQKQQDGRFGTQTAQANLNWISVTLETIQRRTKITMSNLQTKAWGYK